MDFTQNENIELSFDDIQFDSLAEDLAELASESVLPSGVYLGQVVEVKAYTKPTEDNRQYAELKTQLFDDEGKKLRKVKVKISWEKRISNGRIDKPFRMFAAMKKALQVESNDPRELIMSAKENAFKVSVSEAYLVHESDRLDVHATSKANNEGECWVNINSGDEAEAQRMHYLSAGYSSITLVQGVYSA